MRSWLVLAFLAVPLFQDQPANPSVKPQGNPAASKSAAQPPAANQPAPSANKQTPAAQNPPAVKPAADTKVSPAAAPKPANAPTQQSKPKASASKPINVAEAEKLNALLARTPKLEYNRDIRPILSENCFACHGVDSAARQGDLRLDQREAAMSSKAIVPGKLHESELINRIVTDDADLKMPPAKSHKTISPGQLELLKRWIAQGAEYQAHWSYIAPKKPAVPNVKNAAWARNSIDRFVLAELEKKGLAPAPEADRRTLARRAALDVTGLPPNPADVEAFVNDTSPQAYDKYLDKLFASPHYGEHRARYWLDAARYADTHGIHFDNFREMWTYRDWVVNAFNQNKRFDTFSMEQLAGDLMPEPSLEQIVATGFNRCNITTNEGGAIDEEYNVLYARDRTETASAVWLGLTMGCAVCHDHKYDSITMRDFYSMSAYFNNNNQNAMDGNVPDTPPAISVPTKEDLPAWEAARKLQKELLAKRDETKARLQPQFQALQNSLSHSGVIKSVPKDHLHFHALMSANSGDDLTCVVAGEQREFDISGKPQFVEGYVAKKAYRQNGGANVTIADAGDFDRRDPFTVSAWVYFDNDRAEGAIVARMDRDQAFRGWDLYVTGNRITTHIINRFPDDAIRVMSRVVLKRRQWHHFALVYDGSGKADGAQLFVDGVKQIHRDVSHDSLKGSIQVDTPLRIGGRKNSEELRGARVQDIRIYSQALSDDEIDRIGMGTRAAYLASLAKDKLDEAKRGELYSWWLNRTQPEYRALTQSFHVQQQYEQGFRLRGSLALVMNEKESPPMAYILKRGEYDKRADQVTPTIPKQLLAMPSDFPANRLGFAKWLFLPEHPLTARVTVNRFWQELFGLGLVRTSGDFGVSGELPSHPELLDWLALEFRDSGWDVKRLMRLMLTSSTYRQSAETTREKLELDPQNQYLSRGPRFRMDAEMIRDYALAASDSLVRKLGGPSVKPYQPEGVWEAVAMPESNTSRYKRDTGEALYRRSMYTFWKRSAPPASMEVLNAPNRETCVVRRDRTNTPIQALVTLNDVQFVEAARRLAELTLKSESTLDKQLAFLSARTLARPFQPRELEIIKQNHQQLFKHYSAKPEAAKELIAFGESKPDPKLDPAMVATWTMLANQVLNLDEVLCK